MFIIRLEVVSGYQWPRTDIERLTQDAKSPYQSEQKYSLRFKNTLSQTAQEYCKNPDSKEQRPSAQNQRPATSRRRSVRYRPSGMVTEKKETTKRR